MDDIALCDICFETTNCDTSVTKVISSVYRSSERLETTERLPFTNPYCIVSRSKFSSLSRISEFFRISKVYAAENATVKATEETDAAESQENAESSNLLPLDENGRPSASQMQIALALARIQTETGEERVKALFMKDHRGYINDELRNVAVAGVEGFVLGYFLRYIPSYILAREQFIKEHTATVFRSQEDGVRRMRDNASLVAMKESFRFAVRIGTFVTTFVLISQAIASYRNKSSPLEFTIGAGITGCLARFNMGLRGMIAGSIAGSVMGLSLGIVAVPLLKWVGGTQEERHLFATIEKMEIERSIVGEEVFKQRAKVLLENANPDL